MDTSFTVREVAEWTFPEERPKDVKLDAAACLIFPGGEPDFDIWARRLHIALSGNCVEHHLYFNDAAAPPGLADEEKIAKHHTTDEEEFPGVVILDEDAEGHEAKNGAAVAKYNALLKASRRKNRVTVFGYLVNHITTKTPAHDLAIDDAYLNRPNHLIRAIAARYVRPDSNKIKKLEAELEGFRMKPGENVKSIKARMDAIVAELKRQRKAPSDKEKRKRFLRSLTEQEFDLDVKKEESEFPEMCDGRTYEETFLYFTDEEGARNLRSGGRAPASQKAPSTYNALSLGTNASGIVQTGLTKDQEKALLCNLATKYQHKLEPGHAKAPNLNRGNPPQRGGGRGRGVARGRGANRYSHIPGYDQRTQSQNKAIQKPELGCFHCGKKEPNHYGSTCPLKAMPQNSAGAAETSKWKAYMVACDNANEVYSLDFRRDQRGTPQQEIGIVQGNYAADMAEEDDDWDSGSSKHTPMSAEWFEEFHSMEVKEDRDHRHLVDSGASVGAVHTDEDLINKAKLKDCCAITASGHMMNVPHEGDLQYTENAPPISGVKHCPDVKKNINSVSQCTHQWSDDKTECLAIFSRNGVIYYNGPVDINPEHVITSGYEENGHYYLGKNNGKGKTDETGRTGRTGRTETGTMMMINYVEIGVYAFEHGDGKIYESLTPDEQHEKPVPRPKISKRKVSRFDPMKKFANDGRLLHDRFAHKSGLRRTIRFQGCLGLPATYKELCNTHVVCAACLAAKMSRCVHPPVFRREWRLGQLMHVDNHYKPILSWSGKRYTIMIVEHVSRYNLPLHIRKKSEASRVLIYAIMWFQRRTGTKMLAMQCDSAPEFIGENTEIYQYCMSKGISIQATSRSNPAENGVAEAYNKVTHYTAEAMKFRSKVADKFWTEREVHACLVDTYIVKPHAVVSAYEMIFGFRPSTELLKVWGCHGFAFIPQDARSNKMKSHMRPGIYMGVSKIINGFLMYDVVSMSFFETSAAVFDEYSFGFSELIVRVSGEPSTIPSEWLRMLNEEWNRLHGNHAFDELFEKGYGADLNPDVADNQIEESTDEVEQVEEENPSSPTIPERNEEVSTGEAIPYDIPDDQGEGDHEEYNEKDEVDENDGPEQGEISSPDRMYSPPPEVSPEREERRVEPPHTPVLKLPPRILKTPKTPSVNRPPSAPSPKKSPARKISFEDEPTHQKEPPDQQPSRRSSRLSAPDKQRNYKGLNDQGTTSLHYFQMIERRQQETLNILRYHDGDPNVLLRDPRFFMIVDEDTQLIRTPKGYRDAIQGAKSKDWMESMKREMHAHDVNKTFLLVDRPKQNQDGKTHVILRCVWKYRVKTEHNVITNHKSRICVDGSTVYALPHEVFAGTPMIEVIMMLFAIAAHYNTEVIAGDVPAAYVQADMPDGDTVYYVEQVPGFKDPQFPDKVLRLLKCLYGLPHSGHQWNVELSNFFINELKMTRIRAEPCAFIKWDDVGFFIIVVTVDDTIDAATSPALREEIHKALLKKYKWKKIGLCDWHLGMRVRQTPNEITIDQADYLSTTLKRFGHLKLLLKDTPMKESSVLLPCEPEDEITDFPYQCIVGCLIWLCKTRYDICFAVSQVARFMRGFGAAHVDAVLWILGYLTKNPNYGLGFQINKGNIKQMLISLASDSSWADVLPQRQSSYGYFALFNGNCFCGVSKKTPMIAIHNCEAEYYAFCELCREAKFIFNFLTECRFDFVVPFRGLIDNQAAKRIVESWKVSQRTKHIDVACQYSREIVIDEKVVKPEYVPTGENFSDILTKALAKVKISKFRGMVLVNVPNCTI
jgi:hypothetical protein